MQMSWKTSAVGALMIIAGVLGMAFGRIDPAVGSAIILGGLGFIAARDDNKTSEDVGAPSALAAVRGHGKAGGEGRS